MGGCPQHAVASFIERNDKRLRFFDIAIDDVDCRCPQHQQTERHRLADSTRTNHCNSARCHFSEVLAEGGNEAGVVRIVTPHGSLLKNHGVFTIGKDGESAVKAAVMVEDVAKTAWLALQLGQPLEIPPEDVKKLHRRYTNQYGQK
jgi:ribulose-5-phosphate 4-epimerase/fuculose-1-phosphate aldolase